MLNYSAALNQKIKNFTNFFSFCINYCNKTNVQENDSLIQARQGDEIAFRIISIYVNEVEEQSNYTAKMLILTRYDIKVALNYFK